MSILYTNAQLSTNLDPSNKVQEKKVHPILYFLCNDIFVMLVVKQHNFFHDVLKKISEDNNIRLQ